MPVWLDGDFPHPVDWDAAANRNDGVSDGHVMRATTWLFGEQTAVGGRVGIQIIPKGSRLAGLHVLWLIKSLFRVFRNKILALRKK